MNPSEFDMHLFEKFVDISQSQASALSSLADTQRRDEQAIGKLAENQAAMVTLGKQLAEAFERVDKESGERTAIAVDQVKAHIDLAMAQASTERAKDGLWTKVLCAAIGLLSSVIGAAAVIFAAKIQH